jgi:photosystem II stability/assembly factor-like uncharacterized protein
VSRRLIRFALAALILVTAWEACPPVVGCSAAPASGSAAVIPARTTAAHGPAGVVPAAYIAAAASIRLALPPAPATAEGSGSAAERAFTQDDIRHLKWRSVGPANMGGRVAALALVPGSRTSFYVGYATGGIYYTDNLGTTFKSVFDDYPVLSIGALAVADAPEGWPGWAGEEAAGNVKADKSKAEQGKGRIVWVGTGEGNGRNSSSWGGGVYRSTDAGKSFQLLGLEETHDIARLAVDPRDPDVAYVAALGHLWGANAERGIYKTTDGGKTWTHALFVEGEGGQPDGLTGACDVVLDPKNPETVYAALYARRRTRWSFTGNSEAGGIFRSDDAGATWKKLAQGLPPRTGRIGLAVFPKDPRILYAVVESNFGGLGKSAWTDFSPSGGVFRSDDRGESWTRVSKLNPRPFYFARIAVDPEDDQRVYLPGWNLGISDDGGKTFRRSGSEFVHVDFHAIVINPLDPTQIIVGNDGGAYITHDRAKTWDYLNNVAAGQFYRISADMSDPYRIGGGLQDNGSWVGPSETLGRTIDDAGDGILNSDWRMIHGGDGFTVAFDPENPDLVYATSQGGYLARIRMDNSVKTYLKPEAREGEERLRFNWDAPFFISKHDPSILYQGGNKVYRMTGRGDLWFPISGDLTRNEVGRTATVGSDAETYGTLVSLAESPLRKGLLWAGSDDGLVHVTEDEGGTWSDVTPAEVARRYISRIVASQHDASTAYVAVDGHRSDNFEPLILMTADMGKSWTKITGDLPDGGPVRAIAEDPARADVLYCGTEFGIFVSLDRGGRWVRINGPSLPPVAIHDMVVHPRERDLVLGTHGRSVYILDDASMFAQLTPEVLGREAALLEIMPGTPRFYAGRHYGTGHGVFRAKNPPLGTAINYWLRDGAEEKVKITITDGKGLEIRKLEGTAWKGLNRVTWDLQADPKHLYDSVEEGRLGRTQFVPAGEYTAALFVGKEKIAERTVTVRPAPDAEE